MSLKMCCRATKQKEVSSILYHIPILVKYDKYIVNHLTVVNKQWYYLKKKITLRPEDHRTSCNDDKSTVSRKRERNIALRRLKNTWENNTRTDMNDIKVIEFKLLLVSSEQGRAEGSTLNLRITEGTNHFFEDNLSLWRTAAATKSGSIAT